MDVTEFATYEDFLDSQVQPIDLYYLEVGLCAIDAVLRSPYALQDEELARQLVELGFRGTGEVSSCLYICTAIVTASKRLSNAKTSRLASARLSWNGRLLEPRGKCTQLA